MSSVQAIVLSWELATSFSRYYTNTYDVCMLFFYLDIDYVLVTKQVYIV